MAEQKPGKFKVKIPKLGASNKTYDFSLSLPGMISAVGAGVLALTFFFVMGILIGRGYRPEADVPPLQEIMPTNQHGQIAEQIEPPEILKPEELEYPERLKETPEARMAESAAPAAPKPTKKPQGETKQTQQTAPAPKQVKPTEKPAATQQGPVYDYTYQVASFRDQKAAEGLKDKLAAAGLRMAVQSGDVKGKTWYRVNVLHHGTPASTGAMKAVLAQHGIAKPLLKKKIKSN